MPETTDTTGTNDTTQTTYHYTCANCGTTSEELEFEDPYTTQTYGRLVAMQYHSMDHHGFTHDQLRHGAMSVLGLRPNRNFEFCVGEKSVFSVRETPVLAEPNRSEA